MLRQKLPLLVGLYAVTICADSVPNGGHYGNEEYHKAWLERPDPSHELVQQRNGSVGHG